MRLSKNHNTQEIWNFIFWVIGLNLFAAITSRFLRNFFLVCNLTLLIALLSQLLYWKMHKLKSNENLFVYKTIAIAATTYALLILGPLNVDRSISVWMLHQIELQMDSPSKLTEQSLNRDFERLFTADSSEFGRRINEQLSLGNIKMDKQKNIELSWRGNIQVKIDRAVALFFDLHRKYAG